MTYQDLMDRLGSRDGCKMGNNTYLRREPVGDQPALQVVLHTTPIATAYEDGTWVLRSGGWWTRTTRDRLNRFTPFTVTGYQPVPRRERNGWGSPQWRGFEVRHGATRAECSWTEGVLVFHPASGFSLAGKSWGSVETPAGNFYGIYDRDEYGYGIFPSRADAFEALAAFSDDAIKADGLHVAPYPHN